MINKISKLLDNNQITRMNGDEVKKLKKNVLYKNGDGVEIDCKEKKNLLKEKDFILTENEDFVYSSLM